MKIWKEFKDKDIDFAKVKDNINSPEWIAKNQEQLSSLYYNLFQVFPWYKDKYSWPLNTVSFWTDSKINTFRFSSKNLSAIIKDLENIYSKDYDSLRDNYDFSSHELDDLMEAIQNKKSGETVVKLEESNKIKLNDPQIIKLRQNRPIKVPPKETAYFDKKINVAIDGPSGSGKSTIAKLLAIKYNLTYINTGLVYRAMALHIHNQKIDFADVSAILKALKTCYIKLKFNEQVYLNNNNVSKEIRSDDISQKASIIAAIPMVRRIALRIQKKYAKKLGTIMDGRDTTFKIMPHADIKIFLDTSAEVRAMRRVEQNKKLGFSQDFSKILSEIKERDYRDRHRDVDPLHQVPDAVFIDASDLTIDRVVTKISEIIKHKIDSAKED